MNRNTETRSRSDRIRRAGWLLPFLCVALAAFIGARHLLRADSEAQRTAAIARCREQQRTLADAFAAYRNDHDGELPRALGDLYPEYVSDDVFLCPLAGENSTSLVRNSAGDKVRNSAGEELVTAYDYVPGFWGLESVQHTMPWRVFMDEIVPENGDRLQLLRCGWHNLMVGDTLYFDAVMIDGRLADAPHLVDFSFGRRRRSAEDQQWRAEEERKGAIFAEDSAVMPPVLRYR